MAKEVFTLPECLRQWVDENMEGINADKVRFIAVDRLPFQWVPGFKKHIVGITIINRIYIRRRFLPLDLCDKKTIRLILHELVHIRQVNRMGAPAFLFFYLWTLRKGYYDHPLEIEAREEEDRLFRIFEKDNPCDCKNFVIMQ